MSEITKEKCTLFTDRIDLKEFVETIINPFQSNPIKNMFAAISHQDGSITVTYAIEKQ